ncbi:hypothetical protein WR25_24718 [Diploscapter pachys]|uniref:Malonyl-CoA:ACP transacylase (MAT) domain-containing protein n=1 Tax=Diploscapter pachys TaxID=2018661 RepID=A0A2A2L9D7_9BILA|nr:hypothetical protein WR25_24718 [Diploscapter pachys]
MADEEQFRIVVKQAENFPRAHHHIGGNAALMADRIATMFPSTDVHLVGPIGPRAQALLHPSVKRTNSTRIDELHIIMEYRQGEILGDWVAPSSSRFITSHDHYSGSTIVMEMFFKATNQFKPELVIITGIHLLEFQKKEIRLEKLRMIKRNLMQMNPKIPVHLQLGSLGDAQYLLEIVNKVLPYVDSLGLNEQELSFLSHVTNGPHMEAYPVQAGTVHVHKVSIGTDWTNSAAGLAAGARIAGRMSCNLNQQANIETDLLEIRMAPTITLDRTLNKVYHFDPHNPMASWMREDMLFIFTPVLVCRFPTKTMYRSALETFSGRIPVSAARRLIRKFRNENQSLLDEACTFQDVAGVLANPVTKLPYPEAEVKHHLEKTSRELLNETRKQKFMNKRKSNEILFDHIPIEEQIILLFPGQGAQFVGMGKALMDCQQAKEIFERASEILGYDIYRVCVEGPSSKLEQTLYCQPAIFVSSVAAFEKLRKYEKEVVPEVTLKDFDDKVTHVAGFSVGEYAAMYAAGMISFEDAVKIVDVRAKAMQKCNDLTRAGMMTVTVNAKSRLEDALHDAINAVRSTNEIGIAQVANYLYCGVRVIGGSELCLQYLEENQKLYDITVMKRLPVSGAFHTTLMASATEELKQALIGVKINPPKCNIYSNYTGALFPAKNMEIRKAIIEQISNPVKWEQIQQILFRKHQDYKFPRFIEVGPGKQLGAMLFKTSKKAYKTYEHFSC